MEEPAPLRDELREADEDEKGLSAPDFLEKLGQGSLDDPMIDGLYSLERGRRVEVYGIQLDEMWSFVEKKKNKQWIWLALNPVNRQIIAFHLGGRSAEDARKLWENIPDFFKETVGFFSDYWRAYQTVFDSQTHFAVGKQSGLTAYIERFNCTIRQRASRLVRKSLSFSKKVENHLGAIKYFIVNYNIQCKALHV